MGVYMTPGRLIFCAFFGLMISTYFTYLFLSGNENFGPTSQSLDDLIVSNDRTWIKDVLSPFEPGSKKYNFSDNFGRYYHVNSHCDLTLDKSMPRFDKLVFIVIDALRVDFVPTIEKPGKAISRMNFLEKTIETSGIGLLSLATIPTVTLPRIKALVSGKLPSFLDYITNIGATSYQEENFIQHLAREKHKRIVFYGDDTWSRLFSTRPAKSSRVDSQEPFTPTTAFPPTAQQINYTFVRSNYTSSLFATDYTYVDLNVTWNVKRELKHLKSWDVMILHYLGVDHIGHLRGYHSNLFDKKLNEMDGVFETIFETVQNKTQNDSYLFVITGDHGMTNSGNHGGATREETHTAAVFVTTQRNPAQKNPPTNKDVRRLKSTHPLSLRTIKQIDIASTISALFNIPFTTYNQGRVVSTVLERFNVDKNQHLCHLFRNSLQIQYLIEKELKNDKDNEELEDKVAVLKDNFLRALNFHHKYAKTADQKDFQLSKKYYQNFLQKVQINFVKIEGNYSSILFFVFLIGLSFLMTFILLGTEYYSHESSILFCRPLLRCILRPINYLNRVFLFESHATANVPKNPVCLYQYLFHFRVIQSSFGALLALACVIGPIALMGSVRFLELEHFYWYWVSQSVILFLVIVAARCIYNFSRSALRGFIIVQRKYKKILFSIIASMFLLEILLIWRRPILTESDVNNWDIYTYLMQPESKTLLGVLFTFSLAAIFIMLPIDNNVKLPKAMIISSFVLIYLYRTQTGDIRLLKIPFINSFLPRPSNIASLVWYHCFTIVGICFYNRCKASIHENFKFLGNIKLFLPLNSTIRRHLSEFNRFLSDSRDENMQDFSSFLHTFTFIVIIGSTLLVEPALVPVLALNMALEKLINIFFVVNDTVDISDVDRLCTKLQAFFRLVVYHVMAFSSFYQLGNANSLSTINVNACFIGLESYNIYFCAPFMFIAMFSTFLFWILAYYIRVRQFFDNYIGCSSLKDFHINELSFYDIYTADDLAHLTDAQVEEARLRFEDEMLHKRKILNRILVDFYTTFTSSVQCSVIIRLGTMSVNMLVTLILRHHLFIWSVVCPKLLYELTFTFVTLLLHFIIYMCFTHDNCFHIKIV